MGAIERVAQRLGSQRFAHMVPIRLICGRNQLSRQEGVGLGQLVLLERWLVQLDQVLSRYDLIADEL